MPSIQEWVVATGRGVRQSAISPKPLPTSTCWHCSRREATQAPRRCWPSSRRASQESSPATWTMAIAGETAIRDLQRRRDGEAPSWVETTGSHRGENGESHLAASAPMRRREGSCKGPKRYRRANAGFRGCTCGRRRGRTCGLARSLWIFTRSNPLGSGGPAGTSTRSSARWREGPTTSCSGSIARSPRSSLTPTTWPFPSLLGKTPSRERSFKARATTRPSSPPRSSSTSWPLT